MTTSLSMASSLIRALTPERRAVVTAAAWECIDLTHYFAKRGRNAVTTLQHGASFAWWKHYPARDAHDERGGACYYYHAHVVQPQVDDEHGHFHVFLQPSRAEPVTHIVALSIDAHGLPVSACTVNRWVTGERMRPAREVMAAIRDFRLDTGRPRRNVDRWLASLIRLFSPQIEWLLMERDRRIAAAPGRAHTLEDRELHVLSRCPVSIASQIEALDG
ncbi:MAG: hypothetical protein EPN72_07755 [Nevskiaceae bacterium]|nr:MAG: hypothetical protein EPN63_04855 [Nevskiaceae bacterium]TBR73054.1 MAG: hypothetical protein EPN72_07755 [Nevskiaceae bacterium]